MGFQKLQSIDSGAPSTAPVTVRLTKRATVVVQVKKSFIGDAASTPLWSRADVFLGDGADVGKLRIEPASDGLVAVTHLKHGVNINVGRLAAVGPGPSKSHVATAALVNGAIELTIPALPQVETSDAEADVEDEDADEDGPNYSADDDQEDEDTGAVAAVTANGETIDGVTIDLTEGCETVTARGLIVEVTKRQAKLVYLLAKNRTSGSTRAFLRSALWDGKEPAEADQVLTQIITDIADVLAPLKLAIVPKGVGFRLVDL